MNRVSFFAVLCAAVLSASCSIQYQSVADNSDAVPEFTLRNASVSRYEKGVLRVRADAALVEQYKNKNVYYAQGVECEVFADDRALQTKGMFGFIAADIDNELYTFFDSVTIENYSEETSVRAETLKWSGKTGLLASAKESTVTITRQNADAGNFEGEIPAGGSISFSFTGSGFSADAKKRTYRFSDAAGRIDTEEK
jgi:hypothetical protein